MSELPPIWVVLREYTAEYVAAFDSEQAARDCIDQSSDGLFVQIDGIRRSIDDRTATRTITANFEDE